ncbi:MAG TPA: hypothetical protein VF997_04235 [Polyangia bacterium]
MPGVEVTTEHWPLLLVKFDGEQTMHDVDYFIREMSAAQARRQPYASISLMRKYSSERRQVQKVAQWMKATADETRRWCVGNGIVSQSLGFRFLLSSIFLVKPMPCPYQVCASWDEALAWVRGVATGRGLEVPSVPNLWNV